MPKVLVVRKGQEPRTESIEGLEAMQKLVGGWIEMVGIDMRAGISMVCNEEGKLMKLPPNLTLPSGDIAHGDLFFMKSNSEGGHVSLSQKEIKAIRKSLRF